MKNFMIQLSHYARETTVTTKENKNIYETSLYSERETTAWIEKNLPYFYIVDVN